MPEAEKTFASAYEKMHGSAYDKYDIHGIDINDSTVAGLQKKIDLLNKQAETAESEIRRIVEENASFIGMTADEFLAQTTTIQDIEA